jgi:hypothetical protein
MKKTKFKKSVTQLQHFLPKNPICDMIRPVLWNLYK